MAESFTDDEIQLLLEVCIEYKAEREYCGIDWESVRNKGQCTTEPTATTVQSSKQLIVKLHAKNQKILERGSEYNFEEVHFEPKFDLLNLIGPGQRVFPNAT